MAIVNREDLTPLELACTLGYSALVTLGLAQKWGRAGRSATNSAISPRQTIPLRLLHRHMLTDP